MRYAIRWFKCKLKPPKKRISAKYRAYNLDRRQPFSVNHSHAKLIHHFTMEYLVKGVDGLPVYEEQDDDTDTEEEYEHRVLANYHKKDNDYELIMNDRATAENRLAFRAMKERNAQSGGNKAHHRRPPSRKKIVTVKTAKPQSINVSSALVGSPAMQPQVQLNRLQSSAQVRPPKRKLSFSTASADDNNALEHAPAAAAIQTADTDQPEYNLPITKEFENITAVATVHVDSMAPTPDDIVLAFEDL